MKTYYYSQVIGTGGIGKRSLLLHPPQMSENFELGFGVIIHDYFGWKEALFLISSTRPIWFCSSGKRSQTFEYDASTDFHP